MKLHPQGAVLRRAAAWYVMLVLAAVSGCRQPTSSTATERKPSETEPVPESSQSISSTLGRVEPAAAPSPGDGQVGRGLPPAAALPSPPRAERGAPGSVAGYIFDVPVPLNNYYFARRVSHMFPHPWEEGATSAERERYIWEALILHYESFRRNITVTDEELEKRINSVLKSQQQSFTRAGDRGAYAAWVQHTVKEDVALFENQMRYLLQIDTLKDQMRTSMPVIVTEQEMQEEFLNEQHHVGGEMVTFDAKAEAEALYQAVKDPAQWEAMKTKGGRSVRPVSLMTLEAYMDLWSIPKDQMYAFHAMEIGSVGPPMPFGKQWCVYRLLDKRTGDLNEFPRHREAYDQQLQHKKQYEALKQWIEELKASARLKIEPSTSE